MIIEVRVEEVSHLYHENMVNGPARKVRSFVDENVTIITNKEKKNEESIDNVRIEHMLLPMIQHFYQCIKVTYRKKQ